MAQPRYITVYPAEEVTSINRETEVEPREAGYTQKDVDAVWQRVVDLYETGMNPSIGICLRRHGKVVLDRAIGHAQGNAPGDNRSVPKVLARHDTRFSLFSASKAITAMAVHKAHEMGLAHLDDPVAKFIPEFGRNRKHRITLRHILTHRAGIPMIPPTHFKLDSLTNRATILDVLCELTPATPPGEQMAYHALTGGFIFGEVIERASGVDLATFVRREILEPAGLRRLGYGVPEDIRATRNYALNATTGPDTFYPLNKAVEKVLGLPLPDAINLTNEPLFLTSVVPSGNIYSTSNDISRFFQLLLNGGDMEGNRIFEPETIQRAIAGPAKFERDGMLGIPMRYGMGFMLGGRHYSLYSPDTEHVFGHIGLTNVVAYADPARDITLSLMTTGKCILSLRLLKWLWIMREISARTPKTGRLSN